MATDLDLKNINEFTSIFPFPEKHIYNWDIIHQSKKNVFCGVNKNDENDCIFVKQINIKNINLEASKKIYKEVFLTLSLNNSNYFPKNVSLLISQNNDFIFLIFKDNTVSLNKLINSKYNFLSQKGLIKWIVYQITYGLYVLHSNNIIHHDIKPSNIIINNCGDISIIDFGSAIFKGGNSSQNTISYAAPEFLFRNEKIDEKYDMWGLGIIILELYCRQSGLFENKEINEKNKQLEYIFTKLEIKEDYTNQDLIKILNENKNINFKIPQYYLDKISDEDAKDLINNLLVFNPNKRFSALDVLNSKYLSEFKEDDSLEIDKIKIPNDYQKISQNNIISQNFVDLIRKMQ